MVKHVVLFTFKKSMSRQEAAAVMDGFKPLVNRIPGILSYSWGFNSSPEGLGKGYTCAFVMELTDARARDNYLAHPDHAEFARKTVVPALENGLDSALVFDYDVPAA